MRCCASGSMPAPPSAFSDNASQLSRQQLLRDQEALRDLQKAQGAHPTHLPPSSFKGGGSTNSPYSSGGGHFASHSGGGYFAPPSGGARFPPHATGGATGGHSGHGWGGHLPGPVMLHCWGKAWRGSGQAQQGQGPRWFGRWLLRASPFSAAYLQPRDSLVQRRHSVRPATSAAHEGRGHVWRRRWCRPQPQPRQFHLRLLHLPPPQAWWTPGQRLPLLTL